MNDKMESCRLKDPEKQINDEGGISEKFEIVSDFATDYSVFKTKSCEKGEEKPSSFEFKTGIRKTYSSPIKRKKLDHLGNQVSSFLFEKTI